MATVTFELPDGVFSVIRRSPDDFVKEMRLAAAIHWYSRATISQDKAADIAGLTRTEVLDALAREQVEASQVTIEELQGEVERGLQAHRERLTPDLAGQGGTA